MDDGVSRPRPLIAMSRNDHPLFAQRVPPFFPLAKGHIVLVRE
jgi:hypothetical protein